EIRPSVGIVALNSRDEMLLVGQWRYPHGKYSWEIPRGGSHDAETDMRVSAARELREEAGIAADHWETLGNVDVCNGVTNDTQHLFLASGLHAVDQDPDPEEEIETRWLPFGEALDWAINGHITECCSVAAILKVEALRQRKRNARSDALEN